MPAGTGPCRASVAGNPGTKAIHYNRDRATKPSDVLEKLLRY